MKLVRYGPPGKEKPGLIDSEGKLRDLSRKVKDIDGASLAPGELAKLRKLDTNKLPLVKGRPRLGPCVATPAKFLAIGLNYIDHAKESGNPIPEYPVVFYKAETCIVGAHDKTVLPPNSTHTDWEVELGVVIGRKARYVSAEDGLKYVAGYCVINDVSEREWQIERAGQWDKGKGFDTFGPIGPWVVTRDEVPNPQNLKLWLEVDGHRYQNGSTTTRVFGVAKLVSYLSQCMSLQPGDVISTGTPSGVGGARTPPVFLKPGDEMEAEIAGIGVLRNPVAAEGNG